MLSSAIMVFIVGVFIGSFLNVVILRYNSGKTLQGRSGCPVCGKRLSWSELIPLVSFIVQRGRCRSCRSTISWQYPLVEAVTGVLFLLLFLNQGAIVDQVGLLGLLVSPVAISLLVVIAVYDGKHMIIPDGLVYAFCAFSLATLFVTKDAAALVVPGVWQLLAGPLIAAPFALLWLVSRGRWMGLGDAKLALGIGWALGLSGGFSALILSFWIGAIISLGFIAFRRLFRWVGRSGLSGRALRLTMKSEIPFGPFLVLGFLLVLLFHIDVLVLLTHLSL